jgi:FtsP/CotA-like multicopper oxidase with cupredoxin domain
MTAGILNITQFKWILDPQALAINGIAPNKCNASALSPGQECHTECGAYQQMVKPTTRYRVRIINSGVLSYYSMALEGHKMTLFEADVSTLATSLFRLMIGDIPPADGD